MSCEQIRLYNIPVSDIGNNNFDITITDSVATDTGQDIAVFMRNRNLTSSWITTGSDDTANTTIECDISDSATVNDIFLIGHNFKTFDVEQRSGVAWVNLATVTSNDEDFYHLDLGTDLITTKIRFVVYATIVADDDKRVTRLMITEKLESGQFNSWPIISKAQQETIKKNTKMLSGKRFISEAQGSFSVVLKWDKGITEQSDVDIVEQLFLGRKGVMIWLSGGDETQFKFRITGYRKQDFYIMKPTKNYIADYYKGLYDSMLPQSISLAEVVV